MNRIGLFLVLCCTVSLTASAHEISLEDKVCVCYGDLNDDKWVDEVDVQLLLDCFNGECSEPCVEDRNSEPCPEVEEKECTMQNGCLADFNHNHEVGEGDLAVLLGNWGRCPEAGDVTGDRVADRDDILKVQADMGRDCTQDLDYEGRVGGNDLAIAESAWATGVDHHPGTDLNRDEQLSIVELISVFDSQGRDCRSDMDDDGDIDLLDLCIVCAETEEDCAAFGCQNL